MKKQINPNLIKLAEKTYNPNLALPDLENIEEQIEKPINAPDSKKGFIYVPSIKLYVSEEKTLHGKNWYKTHEELHKQELQMLTIKQFVEFIKYLRENPNPKHEKILDEILTAGSPWRAEWLDAKFSKEGRRIYINYTYKIVNGNLQAQNKELLEECLMKNKTPGINLDFWLKNANSQGLPPKKIPKGSLYYLNPTVGTVARFTAYFDGAGLYCYGNPDYSHSSIGVRAALAHTKKI